MPLFHRRRARFALFAPQPLALLLRVVRRRVLQPHRFRPPVRVRRRDVRITPASDFRDDVRGGGADARSKRIESTGCDKVHRAFTRAGVVAVHETERAELRDASDGHACVRLFSRATRFARSFPRRVTRVSVTQR